MASGVEGNSWQLRWLAFAALLLCTSFLILDSARAEPRLALLISNQKYAEAVGPLKNPHNDIALIKTTLLQIGFAEADIQVLADAGRVAMLQAFDAFATRLRRAGPEAVSFFYYSGHGAANDRRENFLIPVDVPELNSTGFYSSVALQHLLDRLNTEAPEARHFVVFDACRNTLKLREPGSRSLVQPKGFQPIRNIPGGTLIAFSTAEGELASDLGESAGPYATVLAEEIVRPGVEAVTVFRKVQLNLSARLRQKPWTQNGPIGETYFAGKYTPQPPLSEVAQAWQAVQNTENEGVLEDFIRRYGDTIYGNLARAKLADLRATVTIRVPLTTCENPNVWVSLTGRGGKCIRPGSGKSFQDCWKEEGSDVCGPEMVVAPAGRFMMGSPDGEAGRGSDEGPQHEVEIRQAFAIGRFEITVGQYEQCVRDGKCQQPEWLEKGSQYNIETGSDDLYKKFGNALTGDAYPIVGVSWNDAAAYAAWLSKKTGFHYRLLSEAEWEYAARAGAQTRYSFGDDDTSLGAYGWHAEDLSLRSTHPVGEKKPNGWGLHDMHGNVREWVQDCAADYKDTPRDGSAAKSISGCSRVLRDGSWNHFPRSLRSAGRNRGSSDFRSSDIGFRLARTF